MSRRRLIAPPVRTVEAPRRRPGRRDFAALVRSASPLPERLPFTHLTDAYHFRSIMEAGELGLTPCAVFDDEPLLYLFYGRPAYRVASKVDASGLEAYWPICFILKPGSLTAKRIYPFDSGAFQAGLLAQFMHHDMIREDFELDVDPSTPGRLLNLFWDDPKSYFENRDPPPFAGGALDFEARSYSELIRHRAQDRFDERHSTFEIQLDAPLQLHGNLDAVILPSDFQTDSLTKAVEAMGAVLLPFNTVSRHHAGNMVGQIYDICRDFYAGSGGGKTFW